MRINYPPWPIASKYGQSVTAGRLALRDLGRRTLFRAFGLVLLGLGLPDFVAVQLTDCDHVPAPPDGSVVPDNPYGILGLTSIAPIFLGVLVLTDGLRNLAQRSRKVGGDNSHLRP